MSAKQTPSSAATLPEATDPDAAPAVTRKYASRPNLGFFFKFDLPLTPEALAVRIRKNLPHFASSYALVLWFGLSISLVPQWRTFNDILVLMTVVTLSFLELLSLKPNTMSGHSATIINVLFALGVIGTVALILAKAGINLLVTLAIGTPVVLVHAILRRDDLHSARSYSIVEDASTGEVAVPLVDGHLVEE